jgi:uncharacterized membrane protein
MEIHPARRVLLFPRGSDECPGLADVPLMDAVGHLLIIAILFVLIIRGPTQGRDFLVLESKSLWTEAYFMTGLYILAFVLTVIAYYGFHHLSYG